MINSFLNNDSQPFLNEHVKHSTFIVSTIFLRLCAFALILIGSVSAAHAQQVSTEAQQALQSRGLNIAQIKQMAQAVGVNPNDTQAMLNIAKAQGATSEELRLLEEELRKANGTADSNGQEGNIIDLRIKQDSLKVLIPDTTRIVKDTSEDTSTKESNPYLFTKPNRYHQLTKNVDSIDSSFYYWNTSTVSLTNQTKALEYFGYNIFKNSSETFEPANIGVFSDSYVVGPGDELRLVIWGDTEAQYELTIDSEGKVSVPNIGPIMIAGKSVLELKKFMLQRMSDIYAGLTNSRPTTYMDLTLTKLKPIRVFVLGEVKNPGGYNLPYQSDLFSVLHAVGGPTVLGSMRDIRIIRDGQVIEKVDLYDLLLGGMTNAKTALRSNDRIYIPTRLTTVSVKGEVKRPAAFELKPSETIVDLIRFAGGLTAEAYYDRYQIERVLSPQERRNNPAKAFTLLDRDLLADQETAFQLRDGDHLSILAVTSNIENMVVVEGAVYQAGRYQLSEDIKTVYDLIMAADSLRGDAYLPKADLIRTNDDRTQEFISIDLRSRFGESSVLTSIWTSQNNENASLKLQKRDSLKIYTRLEIESEGQVSIEGRVRNPQSVTWTENLRIYDVLFKAGGLFDPEFLQTVRLDRADLVRLGDDNISTLLYPFNLGQALQSKGYADSLLQRGDRIIVYGKEVATLGKKTVSISGSVKNPGQFELQEDMRLSDLLLHAKGFTEDAYILEAEISRAKAASATNFKRYEYEIIRVPLSQLEGRDIPFYQEDFFDPIIELTKNVRLKHRDQVYVRRHPSFESANQITLEGQVVFPGTYTIRESGEHLSQIVQRAGGLTEEAYAAGSVLIRNGERLIGNIEKALAGNSREDIMLLPGDAFEMPRQRNTVSIQGNVWQQGSIKFIPGKRMAYYLDRAGGFKPQTYKYVLLQQGNGAVKRVKRKGLFKGNPIVTDHSVITVNYEAPKPPSERKDRPTIKEVTGEALAALTSTLTILLLVDQLRRN